jgi:hypothetical protein
MGDTSAAAQTSSMAALTSASAAALISAAASAAVSAAASSSSGINGVNIKGLIPFTLDMQSNCYRRWTNLFHTILGRFNLLSHNTNATTHPTDPAWVQADLTVVMWIQATLARR